MPADPAPAPVTCASCGVSAPTAPVTWSFAVEGERRVWTCDVCARTHLRSIEAKLDTAWW